MDMPREGKRERERRWERTRWGWWCRNGFCCCYRSCYRNCYRCWSALLPPPLLLLLPPTIATAFASRCWWCCCYHRLPVKAPRAAFLTFEATFLLPLDLPSLPETIRFSDSSSDIDLISPQKLALALAALMSSGVLPQEISAFGKIYPNKASLGDSIALAAASQRVPLILAVAKVAEYIPECFGI